MKKPLYILAIFIFLSSQVMGQGATIYKNYSNDRLSFRWITTDNDLWENIVNNGVLIKKQSQNDVQEEEILVTSDLAKYATLPFESEDERLLLSQLQTNDAQSEEFLLRIFEPDEINLSNVTSARRILSDYILNTNPRLLLESSFAFEDREIDRNSSYRYELLAMDGDSNFSQVIAGFDFDPLSYKEPPLPEVEAVWGNRTVKLKWNTSNYRNSFYAYEVMRSMNDGPFITLDTFLINPNDTLDDPIFHYMLDSRLLENNDSLYTFRIYGRDYLGLRSSKYEEVSGRGELGIGASPKIDKSELLNTNEVLLSWSIDDRFLPYVNEWRIYVGENWDGPYEVDTTGLEVSTQTLVRPIPYEQNYFRIVAVDQADIEHSSFPILVTHLDTIPPATPVNISATIDTNGVVDLAWDQNFEKDFYGYKVFYGYDTTREMTLAHPKAIALSSFKDTIGLKSMNRNLFYKITAVDRRNNRSPFSEIVKLVKPDVIAPIEPNIYDYESRPAGVLLRWHPSTSGDVVSQQLYRREVENETDWTLVEEWSTPEIAEEYEDLGLEPLSAYAYFLMTQDSAGNQSAPSRPAVVKTLPYHEIDLEAWQVSKSNDRDVLFSHPYSDPAIYSVHLYRSTDSGPASEMAILDTQNLEYLDSDLRKGVDYDYFIKVIYQDGYETSFSEIKRVRYEKDN